MSSNSHSTSTGGRWKLSLPIALMLMAVLFSSVTATARDQEPAKVKVLIAFSQQPGPAEQALVRGFGGSIKYTYHLVPALAAAVPEAALDGLRLSPCVVAVEPDLEAHVIDAKLDSVWGVKRIGAGTIHAQGNLGAGVKVGILYTGIDLDHPDLAYDPSCSASFVTGETLDDGHSHGTHVAGTIAGLDNDSGVVGVAPGATLCIYKVLSNSGSGDYSDIIAAMTYTDAGIYDVCLTVDDGLAQDMACTIAVVYDPDAGFVTGGGWIDSPAGAYVPDANLAGKANFGFVSKYKKGKTTPDGQTEFQFHAADLNFHSSSYDWLVVTQNGANAQFKGEGTINGALNSNSNPYKFMLWAGDDDPDTFRIKIWEEDDIGNETVIYDNGFDQAIAGGSIVIHTKK